MRGDVEEEVIAAKIEAERKEIEDEHAYRREAVKRAFVDTHAASRALHPRMAEKLIAAFDDQALVEELSKAGANDLKLRHLQLSVHLESLRNKWQASKSSMVDQSAHRDHEIEALALERKLKAIDHERWRRKNTAIGGSSEDEFEVASHSSEGERKSVASDDSAYAAAGEKAARDSVEARVAQYNEIIAQQLRLARQSERTENRFDQCRERTDRKAGAFVSARLHPATAATPGARFGFVDAAVGRYHARVTDETAKKTIDIVYYRDVERTVDER